MSDQKADKKQPALRVYRRREAKGLAKAFVNVLVDELEAEAHRKAVTTIQSSHTSPQEARRNRCIAIRRHEILVTKRIAAQTQLRALFDL